MFAIINLYVTAEGRYVVRLAPDGYAIHLRAERSLPGATHLSLGKDTPELRAIEPPAIGSVRSVSEVGGLHHRYCRCVTQDQGFDHGQAAPPPSRRPGLASGRHHDFTTVRRSRSG
jgi:hypothetical protein